MSRFETERLCSREARADRRPQNESIVDGDLHRDVDCWLGWKEVSVVIATARGKHELWIVALRDDERRAAAVPDNIDGMVALLGNGLGSSLSRSGDCHAPQA